MYIQRFVVPVVTAADGSATAYTPPFTGKIVAIHYIKTDFAAGVDFTITGEATGETIWTQLDVNATVSVAPRMATHSTAGVAALYASGGTAVADQIALANDRVQIVIASGGNVKSGTFHVVVE